MRNSCTVVLSGLYLEVIVRMKTMRLGETVAEGFSIHSVNMKEQIICTIGFIVVSH